MDVFCKLEEIKQNGGVKQNKDAVFWEKWNKNKKLFFHRSLFFTRGDKEEAEDLLSSTLLKSYHAKNRSEVTDFKRWVLFILKNTWIDQYRSMQKNKENNIRYTYYIKLNRIPEEDKIYREILLEEIFRFLSEKNRKLFIEYFIKNKTSKEISKILQVDSSVVRKRVTALRKEIFFFVTKKRRIL